MSNTLNIKSFLKILEKVGYPNPNLHSIAKAVGYDLEYFLKDLESEIGTEGVENFAERAIDKLSTDEGIKVVWPENDEYVYVEISNLRYDSDESEDSVFVTNSFGRSKIYYTDYDGVGGYKTIEEISDEVDMGDFTDYQDMIDGIRNQLERIVLENCGFHLWVE